MTRGARIRGFLARHEAGLFLLVALVGAGFAFAGFVGKNQANGTCEQCHKGRGPFVAEKEGDAAHRAYRDGKAACIACHADRDAYEHLDRSAERAGAFSARFTSLSADARRVDAGASDAACLRCHPQALEQRDMRAERIASPKLAAIGLRMDVGRHYHLKEFDAQDRRRYAELRAKDGPSEEERDELAFLEKARLSNCAICHERRKADAAGAARLDKMVNYFTANPMTCFSCHPDAVDGRHPGNKLALPTERVCRRCHNGWTHGRILFFPADRNGADRSACAKCHPKYVPEVARTEGNQGGG